MARTSAANHASLTICSLFRSTFVIIINIIIFNVMIIRIVYSTFRSSLIIIMITFFSLTSSYSPIGSYLFCINCINHDDDHFDHDIHHHDNHVYEPLTKCDDAGRKKRSIIDVLTFLWPRPCSTGKSRYTPSFISASNAF